MTAKEFLRNEEYTEGGEGYILTIQEMADLMEEYAKQKVAEAENTAFEAAREQEIVGEGAEIDLRYKYQTVEDWRNP